MVGWTAPLSCRVEWSSKGLLSLSTKYVVSPRVRPGVFRANYPIIVYNIEHWSRKKGEEEVKRKSHPLDKLEEPKPFAGKVVLPPGRRGVSVHIAGKTVKELQSPLPYTGDDPRSIEEIEASQQKYERWARRALLVLILLVAVLLMVIGALLATWGQLIPLPKW